MKKNILFGTVALLAGTLLAADSKDDIKSAAKKLAEKSNYSWKTTVESAGGGRGRRGPTEGKTEKDGVIVLAISIGDNTIDAVLKGGKGAVKTQDGWKSLSEAAEENQGNAGRFFARMLQNVKTPAAQAEDLASKTKALEKASEVYSGDLTEEGAKELLTFGGRGGGDAPTVSDAKGSVKFWLKDGLLSKYEFKVQGKVTFNGNDRDVDRTSTVEIKDVDSTKVEVPEEAKKKLS